MMNELKKPSGKRMLALLLMVCMCLTMLPADKLQAANDKSGQQVVNEVKEVTPVEKNEDEDIEAVGVTERCMVTYWYPIDFDDSRDEEPHEYGLTKYVTPGNTAPIPKENLDNGERQIIGWTLNKNGTEEYDFSTPVTESFDLYPILNKHMVRCYDELCTGYDQWFYINTGETVTAPDIKDNTGKFEFDKWSYVDENYMRKEFDFSTPITHDYELHAEWKDLCQVIFYCPGDFEVYNEITEKWGTRMSVSIKAGTTVTAPQDRTENDNREILGWTTQQYSTVPYDFKKPVSGNLYLYPILSKWRVQFWDDETDYDKTIYVEPGDVITPPVLEPDEWAHQHEKLLGWKAANIWNAELFDFTQAINQDYVFEPQWERNEYNVHFYYPEDFCYWDENDDYIGSYSEYVEKGKQVSQPTENLNNNIRNILGWRTKDSDVPYDFSSPVTEDINLYPIMDKYCITFEDYKTDFGTQDIYVKSGEKIAEIPKVPERQNMEFSCWMIERYDYDNEESIYEQFDFDQPINNDAYVFAKWKPTYSLKVRLWNFDTRKWNEAAIHYEMSGTDHTDAVFTNAEIPERKGYTFTGWYYNKACTIKCEEGSKFLDKYYHDCKEDWEDTWYDDYEEKYHREGYDFNLYAGWKKNADDAENIGYAVIKFFNENGDDFEQYAGCTIEKGSSIPEEKFKEYLENTIDGVKSIVHSEYFLDEQFTKPVEDIHMVFSDNTNIYVKNTFTFDINCRVIDYNGIQNYQESFTNNTGEINLHNLRVQERAGYTFTGWYYDPACTEKYNSEVGYQGSYDQNLFAGWQKNGEEIDEDFPNIGYFALHFVYNYEEYGDNGWDDDVWAYLYIQRNNFMCNQIYVEKGSTAASIKSTVGDPVIAGHYFAGWYQDAKCTKAFDFNQPVLQHMKVYAKWGTNADGSIITPQNGNEVKTEPVQETKPEVVKHTIQLSKTKMILPKGKNETITATVLPADTQGIDIVWKSSDKDIAVVDNGKITAKKKGKAIISAELPEGVTASCTVLVADVKLNAKNTVLQRGKTSTAVKIESFYPSSDKVASYKSSNTKIVTVDKKGKIKAGNKTGTATITVTMNSGAKASYKVAVQKKKVTTKKLLMSVKNITLKKTKTIKLVATRSPISATEKIRWSSSDKKVATVNKNGTVTAKKKGKVIITATTSNGKKAICKIKVK